jgi:hypothetical protein
MPECEPDMSVTPPTPRLAPTLEDCCNDLRLQAFDLEQGTRALVTEKKVSGEAAAQAMLAVRHLEDARMRLGKVIQYAVQGGVSIYDKK